MSEIAWIDTALTAARPQALGALLRYFRDLDAAEEAFQEASLRAIQKWPKNGPPRDPAAWLIFVGRNAALDGVRRRGKERLLPADELISDLGDALNPRRPLRPRRFLSYSGFRFGAGAPRFLSHDA